MKIKINSENKKICLHIPLFLALKIMEQKTSSNMKDISKDEIKSLKQWMKSMKKKKRNFILFECLSHDGDHVIITL